MQSSVPGISAEGDTSGSVSTRSWSALVELGKPRITALVMVTMLCGALVAPGPRPLARLLIAMFSTALVVAAANALNMYIERDTDALMTRTASRPLPTGPLVAGGRALVCARVRRRGSDPARAVGEPGQRRARPVGLDQLRARPIRP